MAKVTRYAQIADIKAIYDDEQLDLVAPSENGVRDDDAVNRALDEASALIDSYIAKVVTLPFEATVPATLRRPCVDIALYHLAFSGLNRTGEHRQRYEDAVAWLKGVARGEITLGPYDLNADGEDDTDGEEVPRRKTGLFSVEAIRG